MKHKLKKASYWLSIVSIGIVLGISLQFTRAWVEPTAAPPGGNIGAPINTGGFMQFKQGSFGVGNISTAGVPGVYLTTSGANTGMGQTQHAIFGPYDSPSGDKGSLYIGIGRSSGVAGDNRNNFTVYNYGCSGGNCNVKNINLYADQTYLSGNVGIGTTSPGAKLDVQGNVKIVNHYLDANDDGWLRLKDSDNGNYKDFAAKDIWANDGIYLGGVKRTTWPGGVGSPTSCYWSPMIYTDPTSFICSPGYYVAGMNYNGFGHGYSGHQVYCCS